MGKDPQGGVRVTPRQGSQSDQVRPWTPVPVHAFLKQVLSAHGAPHGPSPRTKQREGPAPCGWDHPGAFLDRGGGKGAVGTLSPKAQAQSPTGSRPLRGETDHKPAKCVNSVGRPMPA